MVGAVLGTQAPPPGARQAPLLRRRQAPWTEAPAPRPGPLHLDAPTAWAPRGLCLRCVSERRACRVEKAPRPPPGSCPDKGASDSDERDQGATPTPPPPTPATARARSRGTWRGPGGTPAPGSRARPSICLSVRPGRAPAGCGASTGRAPIRRGPRASESAAARAPRSPDADGKRPRDSRGPSSGTGRLVLDDSLSGKGSRFSN